MNRTPLDFRSADYRRALKLDSEAHDERTDDYDPDCLPWHADPERCHDPLGWAQTRIIGAHYQRWHDLFLEKLGRPARIVELGCGLGGASLWFARRGHQVLGVDAAPKRIRIANQVREANMAEIVRAGGELRYHCGNFFELQPGPLDAVISIKTLHHVPDPQALLLRFLPHLGAQGMICVVDQVSRTYSSACASALLRAMLPTWWFRASWTRRQKIAVKYLLLASGLKKARLDDPNPLEGVGQEQIMPAFAALFRRYQVEDLDPLRLLFVARDMKPQYSCFERLRGLFALNERLKARRMGHEKAIVAHMEDRR